MNEDDPFASPDSGKKPDSGKTLDPDKTIIMPSPGRRTVLAQSPTDSQSDRLGDTSIIDLNHSPLTTGLNPLIALTNPLLNVTVLLRSTLYHKDLLGLRDYLARNIKAFENRARETGIPPEKIIATRYALCTFIDENISFTPWGSDEWGKYSLLIMFHNEAVGGERFFQLLAKLIQNPQANLDILEFMYVCLSLGFEGRYGVINNGKNQLEALRERLARIISKERNKFERDLSPHWQTNAVKSTKLLSFMPLWVLTSLCSLALLAAYWSFSLLLNKASDPIQTRIESILTENKILTQPPVFQAPVESSLAEFLSHEINEGLLTVRYEKNHYIITFLGDGLFSPGSATIPPSFDPVFKRIADALYQRNGRIQVLGHTDDRPIRTVKFPSNWHLSQERANSALQLLVRMGIPNNRINARGRRDADPIDSNETPEGRARNRRVEIIVD